MVMTQTMRAGVHATPPRPLPERIAAWHRDATASAFAIARWEDDGGLVGAMRTQPGRSLSPDGRMPPHGNRHI